MQHKQGYDLAEQSKAIFFSQWKRGKLYCHISVSILVFTFTWLNFFWKSSLLGSQVDVTSIPTQITFVNPQILSQTTFRKFQCVFNVQEILSSSFFLLEIFD